MTHGTLILLTDQMFAAAVADALGIEEESGQPDLVHVAKRAGLERAMAETEAPRRLLAFCTGVIVPPDVIEACEAGAYNVHPGPPAYPGLFPSVFAIYDRAATFGTTIHRLTEDIDSGDIVHTKSFDIPAPIDRAGLDKLAFEHALRVTHDFAFKLCDLSEDLKPNGEQWLGRPRTRKDFDALCRLPENVDADEFDLRYRAVGEGPDHALSIPLFGHRFKLDNERTGDVSRGGQNQT